MTDIPNSPSTGGACPVGNVLIIDDNESFCRTLAKMIHRMELKATYETTLRDGLVHAHSKSYDIIFLDVNLPDGCGLDFIGKLRDRVFPPEIIIVTGDGDDDGAETAISNNAWDYIQKNASFQNIKLSLQRALLFRKQKQINRLTDAFIRDTIVGQSAGINRCLEKAARAAQSHDATVLIMGETGTGKELFARAIHDNSARRDYYFVVVDCAALPEHLVESTLFGHKKGAFTGAQEDAPGLVQQADKGTLFLDEVGELPLAIQKKFLRVLQEKRFRPVGGKSESRSDFRVVCATHRNIDELVNKKLFRQDLYYRLASLTIELPPLRTRRNDIHALVMHHFGRRRHLAGERSLSITPEFLEALQNYDWPGNVRELFKALDAVQAEAGEETVLFPRHLPNHIRAMAARRSFIKKPYGQTKSSPANDSGDIKNLMPLKKHLEEMRFRYIRDLMELARGDIQTACRMAEISRGHLYELLKKYDLR